MMSTGSNIGARPAHHDGVHLFAPSHVRDADDRALRHGRMLRHNVLDHPRPCGRHPQCATIRTSTPSVARPPERWRPRERPSPRHSRACRMVAIGDSSDWGLHERDPRQGCTRSVEHGLADRRAAIGSARANGDHANAPPGGPPPSGSWWAPGWSRLPFVARSRQIRFRA
jgi:hypothetical protein